ncbi:MAG: hypothetical protein HY915_06250 [Desulfovibrio sp.]|nr:hypothetical protein [Desulfovibrio sp.]
MKFFRTNCSAALALVLLAGCSGKSASRNTTSPQPVIVVQTPGPMLDGTSTKVLASVIGGDGLHVTWTASGGYIQPDGTFTAPNDSEQVKIVAALAEFPGVQASTTVPVQHLQVNLSPETGDLVPGQSMAFKASVVGGSPDQGKVQWSATAGTITPDGIFQAPADAGVVLVKATSQADPRKVATSVVSVGGTLGVYVNPALARVQVGASIQLSALVVGTSNSRVIWATNGGTVTEGGLFTPSDAGDWNVVATSVVDPSRTGLAKISAFAINPGPVAVFLQPSVAQVKVGQELQLTVIVQGTTNPDVYWATSAGIVDPKTQIFTCDTAGDVTIVATSKADPTKSATATVKVVP